MIGQSIDVELISEQKDGNLYIQVKNRGLKHINKNIQQQLAGISQQIKMEDFIDSNLSLSVVRRYLDLMNGTIEVSRERVHRFDGHFPEHSTLLENRISTEGPF